MKTLVGVRLPKISISSLSSPRPSSHAIIANGKKPSEDEESKLSTVEEVGECQGIGEEVTEKGGNKVMVVVDSTIESKSAFEWTLSHVVQSQDTVVLLLLLLKPSYEDYEGKLNLREVGFLQSLRNLCQLRRPGVRVEVSMVEAERKDKGPTIVQEAKRQAATLLVIGQRKRSLMRRLLLRWSFRRWFRGGGGGRGRGGVAEYCIQNAGCMTIAVRRKNKRLGGYLITTKRHKNFWLLA